MPANWWKRWGRYLLAGAAGGAMAVFAFVLHEPVPLFDWFDLAVHETGHLAAAFLPEIAMFMAGSLAQILFPLAMAGYFGLRRKDLAGAGFCLVWAGASAWDVSVYAGDAIVQQLPLVGGGQHDWAYILGHFNALHLTDQVSQAIYSGGLLLAVAGFGVIFAGLVAGEEKATAPVRPLPRRRPTTTDPHDPWIEANRLPFHHGQDRRSA